MLITSCILFILSLLIFYYRAKYIKRILDKSTIIKGTVENTIYSPPDFITNQNGRKEDIFYYLFDGKENRYRVFSRYKIGQSINLYKKINGDVFTEYELYNDNLALVFRLFAVSSLVISFSLFIISFYV